MPYIPHTEEDLMRMLKRLGPSYLDAFKDIIPAGLRLTKELDIPEGLAEQPLGELLSSMASKNIAASETTSFLGAGAYNHYIPAVVSHVTSRSEFVTSYTPYQPEISQGTLQAIFEYQTLICQLTSMDVANASLYDGASATAEAVLMARRIKGNKKILVSSAIHPEYLETIRSYLSATPDDIIVIPYSIKSGETNLPAIEKLISGEEIAGIVTQSPNFFGVLEDTTTFSRVAHAHNALSISVTAEPLSLGILRPPGEMDADIAVGEAQSFGSPLNFGGPGLGFMATKDEFVRRMPGRIVGETVDLDGLRSFCLTLSTREQHIRRENATSNICTNEGLSALTAAVYLAALGRDGLRALARVNMSRTEYLKKKLTSISNIYVAFSSNTFNEFTISFRGKVDIDAILKKLLDENILGGINLQRFYPEMDNRILIAVTEMNSKEDIDRFADALKGLNQ